MLKFFRRTRASASTSSQPASLRSNIRLVSHPLLGLALLAAPFLGLHTAQAQSTPETPFQRFANNFDLAVNAAGEFTKSTSGKVTPVEAPNYNTVLTLDPSKTVGYLVTLRYAPKPYFGLDLNYGVARYSETFSYAPGKVQTAAAEYTIGYVVHPRHEFFGLKPFLSAGAGSTAFRPTRGGGEGLPNKARMTYFYAAGVDAPFNQYFGARVQFRQLFFLAPDFGQNYLTNLQHTYTLEPTIGFYLHF